MDGRDRVEVRRARRDDVEAIASVVSTSWVAAYDDLLPEQALHGRSIEADVGQTAALLGLDVPAAGVLVAESDGSIIGASLFGPRQDEPTADARVLYMLYVLPSAWGGTAGTRLFEATTDVVRTAGVTTLLAEVLAGNTRARRFFERRGMTPLDEDRQDWFGTDVTVVRYALGPGPGGTSG